MTTVTLVVARSPYCKVPGPEIEVEGATVVVVRYKCRCGLVHEFRVNG